jgi:hypothetical protein
VPFCFSNLCASAFFRALCRTSERTIAIEMTRKKIATERRVTSVLRVLFRGLQPVYLYVKTI